MPKILLALIATCLYSFPLSASTFTCRSTHSQFGDIAISIDTGVGSKGFMGRVVLRNCGIAQEIAKHFGLSSTEKFDTLNLRPISMDFKLDQEPESDDETVVISCGISPMDYYFGDLGRPLSLHQPIGVELPLQYPSADIRIAGLKDGTNVLDIQVGLEKSNVFELSIDGLKLNCEDGNTIASDEGVCD